MVGSLLAGIGADGAEALQQLAVDVDLTGPHVMKIGRQLAGQRRVDPQMQTEPTDAHPRIAVQAFH